MTKKIALGTLTLVVLVGFSTCSDSSSPMFSANDASSDVSRDSNTSTDVVSASGGSAGAGGGPTGVGGSAGASGSAGADGVAGAAGAGGSGGSSGVFVCQSDAAGFLTTYTAMICAKNAECCAQNDSECKQAVDAALREIVPDFAEAMSGGIVTINCTAFEACAKSIATVACDNWPLSNGEALALLPVDDPNCSSLLNGRAAGEGCKYNYECPQGYCSGTDANRKCYAFRLTDETCGGGDPERACDPVTHFCDTGNTNQCKLRRGNNEACAGNGHCKSHYCEGATGGAAGICRAPSVCAFEPKVVAACSASAAPSNAALGHAWLLFAAFGLLSRRRRGFYLNGLIRRR